jgi:hypothetical protein
LLLLLLLLWLLLWWLPCLLLQSFEHRCCS